MNQRDQKRGALPGRGREFLLFVIASVIGIYSLGQGLQGVFFPGQGISLLWLAVAGAAMWVLVAQAARVKDTWPQRSAKADEEQPTTKDAHEQEGDSRCLDAYTATP